MQSIEERTNTIRALSVMQCARVFGVVTSAASASLIEPQNITVFILTLFLYAVLQTWFLQFIFPYTTEIKK
jgi:hypothetical protein